MKLRWKELIFAFAVALALWYGVSGSEKVESIFEVRIDYRGLPEGYVIRSGLVSKIDVRVRAPVGIVRTLNARNSIFYMDLSTVKKGENIMQINSDQLLFMRNVEVMDITPSRITLDVDVVERKQVPLRANISGVINPDNIAQVTFSPPEVVLSGPASVLKEMTELPVSIPLDQITGPGIHESSRRLLLPEGLDALPPSVLQIVTIGIKRKLTTVTRSVTVKKPNNFGMYIRPDKVRIQLAVPHSMVDTADSNPTIRASAELDEQKLGTYNLPVLVSLPDGVELVKIEPASIAVTLEQINSPAAKPKAPAKNSGAQSVKKK